MYMYYGKGFMIVVNDYLFFYRLIRMSSPNLNYIIGMGAIVLYFNVIVLVIPTTKEKVALFLCNVSTYVVVFVLCHVPTNHAWISPNNLAD